MTELSEPSTLLTVVGLATIAVTVALLVWGRVSPVVAMVVVPILGALVIGASLADIGDYFDGGLKSVMSVVVMFIFAIIYFGIMSDAGLFDPIVRGLILATRGKIIFVTMGTVIIAALAHLDGAGATTFLLTIPALLPLYKALNMSRYLLLLLVSMSALIMNMVPWGGPLARAATATGIDPIELYRPLILVQAIAMVMLLALAVLLGLREKRRISVKVRAGEVEAQEGVDIRNIANRFSESQVESRQEIEGQVATNRVVYWCNVVLTIGVITAMMGGWLAPELAFLVGVAVALPLNFRTANIQMDRMRVYAPNAIMMATIIVAAAVFLGVLRDSNMLESIALSLLAVLPDSVGQSLHLIVGALGVPLDMLTSTDAYYFSVLPLTDATASQFGVPTASTAHSLMIGNIIGTFISPFSPAMWLALGLAGASFGKHLRYSFFIMWGFSILLLGVSVLIGVVQV